MQGIWKFEAQQGLFFPYLDAILTPTPYHMSRLQIQCVLYINLQYDIYRQPP